jgi:hypothetical protein
MLLCMKLELATRFCKGESLKRKVFVFFDKGRFWTKSQ